MSLLCFSVFFSCLFPFYKGESSAPISQRGKKKEENIVGARQGRKMSLQDFHRIESKKVKVLPARKRSAQAEWR